MNVEIGAEAALFPEKEYISGVFVVVKFTLWKTYTKILLYMGNRGRLKAKFLAELARKGQSTQASWDKI